MSSHTFCKGSFSSKAERQRSSRTDFGLQTIFMHTSGWLSNDSSDNDGPILNLIASLLCRDNISEAHIVEGKLKVVGCGEG